MRDDAAFLLMLGGAVPLAPIAFLLALDLMVPALVLLAFQALCVLTFLVGLVRELMQHG